jgi:hypothetical protein
VTRPDIDAAYQEGYDLGWDEAMSSDLGLCPYRLGVGICTHGCWEEPSCVTSEPSDGWPSLNALAPLMERLGHVITPGAGAAHAPSDRGGVA